MNEEAIQHAYDLFTNDGYTKSVDEFKTLMSSNPDALAHSYGLFQSDGYSKSLEEFQALMAGTQQEEVKKKDLSTDATLPTEGGESVSGGSDLLDTSIKDRETQGHQTDISLFTDGSDKDAVAAAAEQERTVFYEEQGLDFKKINELKKRREELEEEKKAAEQKIVDEKMFMAGIKPVGDDSDQYYIPKDNNVFTGFVEGMRQTFSGPDYNNEDQFVIGSREDAEKAAIELSGSLVSSDNSILNEIGDVEKELNESRPQVIKAEEAYNTQITNSFLEQGYRGDRLTQLMENADIKQEYVKSKLITINGQESTGVTVEEGIYDDEFISGLQDGSIKVEVHPSIKDTDYGRYLENAIAVQSNAGGEFGDIKDALMSGGFGTVAGTLEVLEIGEGVDSSLEYSDKGGVLAREFKDVQDQYTDMQRMYQYPGFMQSMRAGEFSDAAFQLGRGIAGSTVQIAISAIGTKLKIPQKYLMGFIGVSAAGQKSLSLKEQRREGHIDMSNYALATNALLSGAAEAVWEIPTFQIIEGIQQITKGAGKAAVRDVTKRAVDGLLKDLLKEGGSEAGTTVTEMIVDHVTGAGTPESFDEIVNEVGNAFVTGVGMAGGMRAVGGSAAVTASVINKLTGVDLTNRIVATIKTVNEDGSLGEKQELTQAEYRKWRKDPKNLKAQLEGGVNVEVFNKDIEGDLQDLVDSASEDVVDANESVDVVGREANSEINELGNDLKDKDSAPSEGRVSKIAQLLNKMGSLIDGSSSNRGVDLKALKANFNAMMSKAGFSVNDNLTNQNTDNANIESTENITEIQSKEQANAIEKALDEGGDLSVVLSQDGVGVSKGGESVSKNNIKLGKFKSKAAAKKALDAFNKKNSKKAQKQKRHVEVQKKNNKEFKAADKGKMDDVSQEDLDGDFNVVSAELDGLDAATNDKRTDNLEKVLKNKGLKYKKVTTIENGVSKTSFMVEGVESNEALSIASGFGQKSITSSKDGVLHSDGTVETLDGNTYDGPDARDGARVIVIKQNGKKKAIRLGTGKKSFAKKFNSNNIADIAKFVEYLPENQKKILGHVLNFFSKIQGLNIGIVKNTYAMKQQLEADGYNPAQIDAYARNRAIYRGSDGTMYLNLEVMNMNTPFHEIIHPLVNFIKETDPEVYSKIEDMVSKSEPGMIGSPFRKRWIDSNGRRQSGSYLDWVKGQDAYKNLSRQDQVEEAFAEMMGDAAANQFQKDNSKLKQIYDAIREMLSVFNINIPADKNLASLDLSDLQNIGDLRSGIGSALAKGTSLNVGGVDFSVGKPKNSEVVDNSIKAQVNSQEQGHDLGVTEVTSFEGVETQDIKAQAGDYTPNFDNKKVKRGSISEFNGQKAMLMCIDRSVSGSVESPSGVVKEFNGGMYFSYQEGNGVWAFAGKASASKVINQAKNSNGLIFLTLMAPQSIDGTVEMFDYVMDEIDNAVKKGLVKKDVALDFLNKKLKLGKVQDKLSKEGISKDNVKSISEFRKLILSLEGAFDVRKDLTSKMIKGKDLSKWGIPTREEMYSFVNQGEIKDLTGNPVVAAIRIDTETGYIDSRDNDNVKDHPTYPYQIKGEPLMVFDQAVDASELWGDLNLADKYLIDPKTGIPFSEGTTTARRNAAIMMGTPIVDIKAQAPDNDGFTGGRSQYARFNVTPNTDRPNALIEDLSEDRVSEIAMKGNWSIITGTVEAEGKYNNEANVSNNAKLYKELVEEFGTENIEVVQGVYMREDQGPSLFVTGITEHRAMQIGKSYSQEGVLTRRGNIFTDGSGMNPASETVFVGDNALNKDGNSTTTSGVTFSLDVDWGTKVPLATGIKAQASDKNLAYRAGDLITKPEQIGKFEGGNRGTGHFGTGFYFFGKKEDAVDMAKDNNRVISELDLSDYNLAEGTLKLHDELKYINSRVIKAGKIVEDITRFNIKDVASIVGVEVTSSEPNPYEKFAVRNNKQANALEAEVGKEVAEKGYRDYSNFETKQQENINELAADINAKLKSKENIDSPSTLVMKALGFEGVDSRGTKLDTGIYGTVVYDIKAQAGNNISEDQLTVLKSTYSDIEKKHPNISVDEGMIKLYHYSDDRLNAVDPRIASRQTYSNQEYRTWGRSRVFFYTDPSIKEGVVGGSVINETLLPIDRVYPLTEDPLNLEAVVKNNLDAKRNSGDKTQSTITLNTKSMDSSVLAISKLKSLLKDMGLSDVVDFGDVTENFKRKKDDSGKYSRDGVESLSFTLNYPIDSDNITSVIKDTFDKASFEKVDPATLPFNYFEEMANVAEGLGFQGFIYDHVGGKTVSSWKPVSVVGDRFQAAAQEDTDVYVSGLGAIMWDLAKPIIDADYELGGWMSNISKPSRRYKKEDSEGKMVSTVRATELFGRPKGLHTNQEIKEMIIAGRAQLNHQLYVANKNQKNLKKVIEAEEKRIKSEDSYKNATPEQQEAMLEHLTPEALNNTMSSIDAIQLLPEQSKLREAMTTVRNHIDVLSMTMYEDGLVSGPMRYTIEGNLGYYLTRSYKQYEDSNWRQDDQEVIRRAEVFVMNKLMAEPKNMSLEEAEVLASQMVKDLVNSKDKDSGMSFMKNSGISGSLHRVGSIFEKRNEALPKEIRELLGERMDPLTNYVNTISKLSRTLISNQMYEDMIDFGMGKFIADPNPKDPDYSSIPDIGNKLEGKKWGPLDGKFVDNEMLDVLKFYDEGDAEMGLATKAWMTFVYGTKKAATVYNPATHAVNLFGNSYFSLMNGHTSPAKFFESFRVAAGQITNLNGKERQAFYEELVSLGVVDSSASLAEVVQIGEDLIQGVDMNKIMDKLGDRMAGKSAKFLLAAAGKADKAATKSYQAEDDLFKIFGYMSEKAKYMEAGLSEKEAKARAVRNTGNTYPNYGRVPAVVRAIGRNPFVGTFVSFTAESIRCTKNAIQLSFDEMGDPNPKIKKMGAKRLASSLLTLKFAESLTSAGISMMFGAFGDDEEEFHKELFGLRHLDAPWNKDSNIAPINKGFFERGVDGFTEENNGHAFVEYMNTSRLSGGGFVKDLLRIAFTDMNTPDYDSTLSRILYKFYGSFLSEDMALGVVRDVIDNKGNKVFNATENLGWNIYDIFKYTVGKLGPGAFKSISRIEESMREDSKRTTTNEVRAMIGLRTTTLDVNDALFFKSKEIIKDMRDRSESLEFDLRQKDMTLAYTLNPSHEMFDKKMSQYFNGLVSAVQTARRLGVNISGTKDNCIDMLKKANVPQEVIDRVIRAALNGEGSETLRIGDK